ncbi:ribbon-helix-helix protein, CopG family [bacterium]|nr:ribbon-helix-helix protein, CopG family [bacterium]
MLSFRVDDDQASDVRAWAEQLGVDRSELLRDALRRHLVLLAAETDIEAWRAMPMTAEEASLCDVADWGVAEDWSDWSDAEG